MNSVRVLVLGDVGRSPRMANHCLSFANCGWDVYFSGYVKSDLPAQLKSNKLIHINNVPETSDFINQRKELKIFLILRTLLTSFYLFFHLLLSDWTHILFIQNPPAVPTILVAYVVCKLRKIKIMVDWHNLGYTLMPGSDKKNLLKRLYKRIELKFSQRRMRPKNFCVSKAFKNELFLKWGIVSEVLYDVPWKIETEKNVEKIHDLFMRLKGDYVELAGRDENETAVTTVDESTGGTVQWRRDRPAILVSSCSWTIDDDFETLFKALAAYNRLASEQMTMADDESSKPLPRVLCVITGKGPMKPYFERLIAERQWEHVGVVMPWLEIADYPTMLSGADLGVSLHKSTSGIDLPMKIVDMFAVSVPVLALNYKCLHELVIDRVNGRLFVSEEGLLRHLCELLPLATPAVVESFPDNELARYRRHLAAQSDSELLWQPLWESVVLPVATDLAIDFYNKGKTY